MWTNKSELIKLIKLHWSLFAYIFLFSLFHFFSFILIKHRTTLLESISNSLKSHYHQALQHLLLNNSVEISIKRLKTLVKLKYSGTTRGTNGSFTRNIQYPVMSTRIVRSEPVLPLPELRVFAIAPSSRKYLRIAPACETSCSVDGWTLNKRCTVNVLDWYLSIFFYFFNVFKLPVVIFFTLSKLHYTIYSDLLSYLHYS